MTWCPRAVGVLYGCTWEPFSAQVMWALVRAARLPLATPYVSMSWDGDGYSVLSILVHNSTCVGRAWALETRSGHSSPLAAASARRRRIFIDDAARRYLTSLLACICRALRQLVEDEECAAQRCAIAARAFALGSVDMVLAHHQARSAAACPQRSPCTRDCQEVDALAVITRVAAHGAPPTALACVDERAARRELLLRPFLSRHLRYTDRTLALAFRKALAVLFASVLMERTAWLCV